METMAGATAGKIKEKLALAFLFLKIAKEG
jgi:hypothetical protein